MNKQGAKYKISPKGKRKLDYPSRISKPSTKLPLIGKTIYLDVKEAKPLKQLQQDLKKLGATLEEFVSRDINYLITSQPRPNKDKAAIKCVDDGPSPSPFNCDPSPSPGYPEDKKVASVTRGKALLEKARYTRQASTLVDNAEKWGVKIVSIEGAFKWIEKELKKLPKLSGSQSKKNTRPKCVSSYKLFKAPFVKLEAETFCYRPFHMELDVWPRLNADTPRGSCPFDGTLIKGGDESREERGELLAAQVDIPSEDTPKEEKDGCESADSAPKPAAEKSGKKSDLDVFGGGRIMTAGELKRRKELKRKQERKRGYCECCHSKYEDLDKHVKEDRHRQYVKTKTNYSQLDTLINSGPNTNHFLLQYLTKAACIVTTKNHNSNNIIPGNNVRRSPRKAVQEITHKSQIKSPCKTAEQPSIQSPMKCQPPIKNDAGVSLKTVRKSPRKSLQIVTNDENACPVSVTPCGEINETRQSPAPSKPFGKIEALPNVNDAATTNRTARLRNHINPQKENEIDSKVEDERDISKDSCKKERTNPILTTTGNISKEEKEESGKSSSKGNLNDVIEKSPCKKKSPRKKLIQNFATANMKDIDNIVLDDNLVKENISNENKENVNTIETPIQNSSVNEEKLKSNTKESKRTAEIETSQRKCTDNVSKKKSEKKCEKEIEVKKGKSADESSVLETSNDDEIFVFDTSTDAETSSVLDTSTDEIEVDNTDLTRLGFAEIVKSAKKRTEIEHSSDDFEVCFARSLNAETLPLVKKTSDRATEKTFDDMIDKCEKVTTRSNCNVSLTSYVNDINNDVISAHQKQLVSKNELEPEKCMISTEVNKNRNEKKKDVYDVEMESDIPSDFQCYDDQGKMMTFSKTLAERIKERSLGRRSSIDSYNMNVLFQLPSRSRSNSFSSNQSERAANNVKDASSKPKSKSKIVENKKTGSSIASAKVVNKYRNQRFGQPKNDNNITGYQGDDENEKTPKVSEMVILKKTKPKKRFWHYEPVVDLEEKIDHNKDLKGLAKELSELKEACEKFSSDTSGSRRSRMKSNNTEKNELKAAGVLLTQSDIDRVSNTGSNFRKPDPSDKTENFDSDKEKIRNSNRLEESGEIDQQNRSESKKGKGLKNKKKKFWYYVTESVDSDTENENNHNIQKERCELKNMNDNYKTDIVSCRSKRNSRHNFSDTELSQKGITATQNRPEVNEIEDSIIESYRQEAWKDGKIFEPGESVTVNTDKTVKSNSRKVFWEYVPVEDNDDEEGSVQLPEGLRDSWNTGVTLDRCRRRRSKTVLENVDSDESCRSDQSDRNTVRRTSNRNRSKLTESDNIRSFRKEMENTKTKSVSVDMDREDYCKMPKDLKDSWNKGDILNRFERRGREKSKTIETDNSTSDEEFYKNAQRRKQNEFNEIGSKFNEENEEKGASQSHKKNNYAVDERKDNGKGQHLHKLPKEVKELKISLANVYISDTSDTDNREVSNTNQTYFYRKRKRRTNVLDERLRKREVRVNYNETDGVENDNQHCLPEPKTDKSNVQGIVTDSDSDNDAIVDQRGNNMKSYSKINDKHSCSRGRFSVENLNKNSGETARPKKSEHCEAIQKVSNTVVNKIVKSNEHPLESSDLDSDMQGNVSNNNKSGHGQSKPMSRKRVFWEYEVVSAEETSVNVDKRLPKELQILHSTWNDLKTVERRARSCQLLDAKGVLSKGKTEERQSRTRYHRNCTTDKNLAQIQSTDNDSSGDERIADDEVCYINRVRGNTLICNDTMEKETNGKVTVFEYENSGKNQKDLRSRSSCREISEGEEDQERVSPVFSKIQNNREKVAPRSSPVFNKSPNQCLKNAMNVKSSGNKYKKISSKKFVVKGKSVKQIKSSNIQSKTNQKRVLNDKIAGSNGINSTCTDDFYSDKEVNSSVTCNRTDKDAAVKTPEKVVQLKQPGSGYSNTPREKRRKQFKRKDMESENDSACPDEKKRKLEETTDLLNKETEVKKTPRRRLLETEYKENHRINDLTADDEIADNSENASHNLIDNQFSLIWKPTSGGIAENKSEKVKLNKSWTMLSERSVSRLLSSEDDNENFDGFTDEDKMPSDMSYEEQSEVEIPNDDKLEWVVEDKDDKSEIEENLKQYVPVFFPSPNKTSNSSWNDAIEGYIDYSVKQGPESSFKANSSSMYFSFNCSPRKSPMKRNFESPSKVSQKINERNMCSPVRLSRQSTPKRKRNKQMLSPDVEKVDAEIEFNFGSPQKNRSDFSPLRCVNGVIRNFSSSTENLTSTPVLKKSSKQKETSRR